MAKILNMVLFIALVVASMLPVSFPALSRAPMTYIVGDGVGWTVPPGGPSAYQTWARGQSFVVGDVLVFDFPTGAHDVAEVSKTEYDSCNTNLNTNSIAEGPAKITLTSAGEHHYMCTVPSHCSLGQRLAINVVDAESSTSTPPSSSTPTASAQSTSFVPTPAPSTQSDQSFVPTPTPSTQSDRSFVPPSPSFIPTPTPSTQSDQSFVPPSPSNSPPTFAKFLPFTFMVVALAFLYN